jgi:hypothetical protein
MGYASLVHQYVGIAVLLLHIPSPSPDRAVLIQERQVGIVVKRFGGAPLAPGRLDRARRRSGLSSRHPVAGTALSAAGAGNTVSSRCRSSSCLRAKSHWSSPRTAHHPAGANSRPCYSVRQLSGRAQVPNQRWREGPQLGILTPAPTASIPPCSPSSRQPSAARHGMDADQLRFQRVEPDKSALSPPWTGSPLKPARSPDRHSGPRQFPECPGVSRRPRDDAACRNRFCCLEAGT